MNIVSLTRRLFGTVIDIVLISSLFVIVSLTFSEGHPGGGLGTFMGLLNRGYNKIESVKTMHEQHVENTKFMKENGLPVYDYKDDELDFNNTAQEVYNKYLIIFILVNLVYYGTSEFFFRASLGKRLLKCRVCKSDGSIIDNRDVFQRLGLLATLMMLSVAVEMTLNLNAYITSVLFFLALDFMVFTRRQSLIDKYSDTYVIKINKNTN